MTVLRSPIYSPLRSPIRSPLTRIKGGGGVVLPAYQQVLALAVSDGWTASYDPTNPDTRTLVSGNFSALADGLGNLPTLTQTTAGRRPVHSVGVFGDLDGMVGDGTKGIGLDITNIPQPFSILCVVKWSSTTARNMVTTDFSSRGLGVTAGPVWRASFGTALDGGTADTNPHIIAGVGNGASSQLRQDGSVLNTGNAGTAVIDRLELLGSIFGSGALVGTLGPTLIRSDADTAAVGRMEALLAGFF